MYQLIYGVTWLVSLLPFWVLYCLSDVLCFFIYRVFRYRRRVVRNNLMRSFPEKKLREIKRIERGFYAFFSDYLVETIKMCSISDAELRRRMQFEGVEEMVKAVRSEGKHFGFIYLAHYGNWEWISSLATHIHAVESDFIAGQVYHPLRNAAIDRLFLHLRSRFGGVSIPMKETLRFVLRQRQAGKSVIIGFIADQNPKWNSIHHWTPFLHRHTPVFIGTERIAKQVDALLFYGHVERVRRGHYRCILSRLVKDPVRNHPDYELTDIYFRLLETSIHQNPSIWLWSHKRWKRTYEEYQRRMAEAKDSAPHEG